MRRIFWDTMVFIHLLEGEASKSAQITRLFGRSLERKDLLTTSCLAVGEVSAGGKTPEKRVILEDAVRSLGFDLLTFDERCISSFGLLRTQKVAVADSIHLACAAAAGVDLFLTDDRALQKLHVPGIKFIAGLESGLL